jgi:D-threo-aldose 1-dehydrogenase
VASIVPGAVRPEEATRNAALITTSIPAALWRELKNQGLLDEAAPAPG